LQAKGAKILVIDDEPEIRRLLEVGLKAHGFEYLEASNGQEGLAQAAMARPDLIILDMGLPDMDGLEVIMKLREWSDVPTIILSVREQEFIKIEALDHGADDYLTKPFSMGELMARIRVALRHNAKAKDEPVLVTGDLVVDLARRRVRVGEKEVKLTPTEYEVLKNLAVNMGKVMTHRQLLNAIWGKAYEHENHYLRIYIGQLRRKLEPDPTRPVYIITEPGVGYRLQVLGERA
jgi:two-component system KDP operon response regulator KdpE